MEVRCAFCRRHFYKKSGRHRFCSPACRYRGQALTQATKYDRAQKRLRAELAPAVAAGRVSCSRCGLLIEPGEQWHLDHAENADPHDYRGVSHAYCNTTAPMTRAKRERALLEDDPERGIFWSPPMGAHGQQERWSRPWTAWRNDPAYAAVLTRGTHRRNS
jgi:hypothetical protein